MEGAVASVPEHDETPAEAPPRSAWAGRKGTAAQPYWWRLLGDNSEILCRSENYASKASAQTGIAAVKRVAGAAPTSDLTGESSYSSYYR